MYNVRDKILTKKENYSKLDTESRKILINFYQDDVKKLEKFLGKELPWPNFKD